MKNPRDLRTGHIVRPPTIEGLRHSNDLLLKTAAKERQRAGDLRKLVHAQASEVEELRERERAWARAVIAEGVDCVQRVTTRIVEGRSKPGPVDVPGMNAAAAAMVEANKPTPQAELRCTRCGERLGEESIIGDGDGTGRAFAHYRCHERWQRECPRCHERFPLDKVLAHIESCHGL